jgi:spermidine synthase
MRSETMPVSGTVPGVSSRALPLILLLMAGSGCAALIYEVVWLQLLQLVIGASAVSMGLLLAAYMGGLCLGSALLPRFVPRRYHPLRVYAFLELGIGALGLLALTGVPLVARIYAAASVPGLAGIVLRGLVASFCLLPPTLLMGGSLPAIARLFDATPKGVASLGYLYAANIAGGIAGCFAAGFYLLRVYDMAVATYWAAAINSAVALLAITAIAVVKHVPEVETRPGPARGALPIYLAIALSGMAALGAEVVWTRLLSLLLGPTVYTFSIILAVFLGGLWAGSVAGSAMARRMAFPRIALACCQALLALSIAWTAWTLAYSLPFWPVDPWLSSNPIFNFQLDLARCIWAIFPATVFWGASFPLALAAAAAPGEDTARLSGRVYAVNTAGSIAGALAFSLLLIPAIGTRASEQVLIAVSIVAALVIVVAPPFRPRMALLALTVALAGVALAWTVEDVPWQVIAYGRRIAPILRGYEVYDQGHPTNVLYRGEGINSSVLIAERAGQRHFYVSGKAEASTAILDMRLERMMGDIPGLIHPHPRSVLTVGFGAGVTAGSFVPYPDVERLLICELEPFIPPASTRYFGEQNNNVLHDRRTRMVYDDARHYIFTTREKFDVITTDPIHPWVKGTSVLYSKEYYDLVRQHLNPGGVVAQWLPIYDSDPETIRIELTTFFAAFPKGTIWSNFLKNDGYDLVLLGRADDTPIDVSLLQQRLDRPDYAGVRKSLSEVGFNSAVDLLATYAGRGPDLLPMLRGTPINHDLNMRLQYIAGLGLNYFETPRIYRGIESYRRFPEELFAASGSDPGSAGRLNALRVLLSHK